jgi:hypothetical protein
VLSARSRIAFGAYLTASTALTAWLLPWHREPPPDFQTPRNESVWSSDPEYGAAGRDVALRRARVWRPIDPAAVDLGANPADPTGALSGDPVRCRYLPAEAHGTTAKFTCVLPDGEVVKVKYGHTGEIHAEIAATRLLTALIRRRPDVSRAATALLRLRSHAVLHSVGARLHPRARSRAGPGAGRRVADFEWVAVERRFEGATIEAPDREGWAFFELDNVDPPGADGARDALRLAAMLLAHWDNKAANQRLVCEDSASDNPGVCQHPFALVHDLGATFGPNKVDLGHWKSAPIWADRQTCRVSMRQFPYDGGTFRDAKIGEAGRQLMARQLAALSDDQLDSLFVGARFREFHGGTGESADVRAWTQVLRGKIRDIVEGPACPSLNAEQATSSVDR